MAIAIYTDGETVYFVENESLLRKQNVDVDALFTSADPEGLVQEWMRWAAPVDGIPLTEMPWRPFIGSQEVWAAGVTYLRSRTARMDEAEPSGGDVFYDLVYEADRPKLFFKASATRVRGHLDSVCIRQDSTWDVPEPELTLAVNHEGKIFGYTIGNDVSSRSIEGENPLYLPQAKVYTGSCSLGPALIIGDPPGNEATISISIERGGDVVFSGSTNIGQIKRSFEELVEFLFRSNEFATGVYLMTGTGVVPDADFTLNEEDLVSITLDGVGTLMNAIEVI